MARNTTAVLRFLVLLLIITGVIGKKHRLRIENDERHVIDMSTFGYLADSIMQVEIENFQTGLDESKLHTGLFGFTLDKMASSSMASLEEKEKCLLTADKQYFEKNSVVALLFKMNFKENKLLVDQTSDELNLLEILPYTVEPFDVNQANRTKRSIFSDSYLLRRRRDADIPPSKDGEDVKSDKSPIKVPIPTKTVPAPKIPDAGLSSDTTGKHGSEQTNQTQSSKPSSAPRLQRISSISMEKKELSNSYSVQFTVKITNKKDQGQYKLTFHNCHNTGQQPATQVNFTAIMVENNDGNYLSAGHIPLPTIYFILSVVFLGLACVWLYVIKKSTEGVYKMHYLMLSLVYIKSLALLFHAVNYHFLSTLGHHEETIAIIYYITYLMRGILLFVTIVLIGAGWAFVKHILSDRDKKIFIIVIPLQILANVAQIFIEETEEGQSQYVTWSQIFIIVDLLCCGAILFPVVWSIRHLQEASQTDGKAAINLVKLKLFRHFYILIVCYIYFTRIIVYLLRIAVPFQYEWMDDLFRELATLVFYIVTGYKFRPASNNPYLQVPTDSDEEDDVEMDEVVTQSAVLENVKNLKVKVRTGDKNGDASSATGISKRESSHEYD